MFTEINETMEPGAICELLYEMLHEAGFDFSPENIDRVESELQPELDALRAKEGSLVDEVQAILKSAGTTDVQLAWGKVGNPDLSRTQLRVIRRLGKQIDTIREKAFGIMMLAAVMNEYKAAA